MKLHDPAKVDLVEVALKSFVLGLLILMSLFSLVLRHGGIVLAPLKLNVIFICLYHMLEFLTTARFNTLAVESDSFLLNDMDIYHVNIAAVVEFLATTWWWGKYRSTYITTIGLLLIIFGQSVRTMAMSTAQDLFNHQIQRKRQDTHRLVTRGVYFYFRHPSYVGFFYWFIGLQLMMHNIVVGVVGTILLYRFFKKRIVYEEQYLIQFFNGEYLNYMHRTRSGILFLR